MPQKNKDLSAICADFLETASKYDNFSYSIIAGDETCSPQYDRKQKYKAQSGDVQTHLHRGSFVPSLRKQNKKQKLFIAFFFNSRFEVHNEFL